MITVGFKEGSKGLGLGFGYEGEIWNPDITFSNIDERLEKVLGTFRKHFKGGISSGNSGPIYGAYGSFLPVYRRLQGGRGREGFSDRMKTKKRSLSLTDRDFISVYKKSKGVDMDPLSASASAKNQPKYDIHPSKGIKCETSKSSKSSVSGSQNGTVTHSLPSVHESQNENGRNKCKSVHRCAATDALKEAVKLMDYADRMEKSGSNSEGTREGKTWNPDITFSNLDERLEKVLGTFRKHFKGGISSGNSGPIYGAYGSFLPVYRRPQGGRVREGFSDWMKTKKRGLRLTDRYFNSACKKSKVDDMDCLSAKDRHKYDIHPSKGRKCESSKSSKSSVPGSQNGTNANQSIAAATDALKEAVKLMDYADRIQKSMSNSEGMSLSFEAALKYLHAASLLESCHGQSEMILQSMQTYRRAAELCESCAHEYEKSKDMAAAALSYKCMEVAYMRIISSSHAGARKDRHELQRDLKIVPHGKYPSSSGSDVDNLGSPATLDNIVAARNRPHCPAAQFRRGCKFCNGGFYEI
ncbi:CW-type zinc finger [Actinidia rufa]|uniref:CW-type zinc finger n=1 Tax=Actinidia rufa TaxID=165716 RepID=A0A7J0E4V6_9ERIC|nr:CW-type zinc finger [Actinidia rufa]